MKTEITELLGIEYPVIQGGMAWVADYHLAAAVSNAGGLGLIAAGGAPAEWVREQIRETKKLTDKPFGVNIMLMNPEADKIAKVILEEDGSLSRGNHEDGSDSSWCDRRDAIRGAPYRPAPRSEERRVGKECRSRWSPYH